ncbi:hypothetical protein AQ915_20605 [Burkholderia pseudomallei]|uniref:type IV secretion system DNA-binding domain-containing protein n=1 Tax=Burkholderia pseudomallei TaxID=28450 RepID=UPI0009761575|nr:type IV secretion system DNA-binding domain-containing protein [Burkholderia pseudomallei]ONC30059.1 hypothetical protein AQ915_20605 [Burkholderia pseudomallei]
MDWISEIWNGTWLTGIWDSLPAMSQLNLAGRFWDGVADFLASYWHDVKIFTGLGIAVYLLAHLLAPFHRFTLFHPPRGNLFFRGLGMWFMYGCPALFLWEFACLFGRGAREYVFFGLIALALAMIYFARPILRNLRGFAYRSLKKPEIVAGTKVIDAKELATMINEEGEPGILSIDVVPIPKVAETTHIALRGGPGMGKTQFIKWLIAAVRRACQRAVVVDPSDNGLIPEFADFSKDILINPFDARSHRIDFRDFLDPDDPASPEHVASMIVPLDTSNDQQKQWSEWARQFLTYILEAIRVGEIISDQEIIRLCAIASAKELSEKSYWQGTPLYVMFQPGQDKWFGGVRGILSTSIEFLRYEFPDNAPKLNIKEWVENGQDSIIWLSFPMTQRKALRRIYSTFLSMATSRLLSMPEDIDRRLWFILDELAELGLIDKLQLLLQEGRKYGACVVAGFQHDAQMELVYGAVVARIILGLFATRLVYRPLDVKTAKEDASFIGEYIEERWNESESENNGGSGGSSGRSYSQQIAPERPAVTATDLRRLKRLQAYLLTEHYPPAKITIPVFKKINRNRQPFFIRAPEKPRAMPPANGLPAAAVIPEAGKVPPAAAPAKPKKPRARKPAAKPKAQDDLAFVPDGEEPPPGDPPEWLNY